jgi:hypothetical protein
MRKILSPFGITLCSLALLVLLLVGGIIQSAVATTRPLTPKDVETLAISYAKMWGFQGEPTSVQSKLITRDEYKARINPFRPDIGPEIWLIVLKGKVWVNMASSMNNPSQQLFENMYVELTINGVLLGTGSRTPGNEIDLCNLEPNFYKLYLNF